jgi:hypothetical protein
MGYANYAVIVTPRNSNAAGLGGALYSNAISSTSWEIGYGIPVTAGNFQYNYWVVG